MYVHCFLLNYIQTLVFKYNKFTLLQPISLVIFI